MPRYIDADLFLKNLNEIIGGFPHKGYVERALEQTTTADVVEVVRCKDCKMYNKFNKRLGLLVCNKWDHFTKYNGFCSYGEKREGERK